MLLVAAHRSRHDIQNAKCAKRCTLRVDQRCAGVEPNIRGTDHKRIVDKSMVVPGVGHNHRSARIKDGVRTEGVLTRHLGGLRSAFGLEPLTIGVGERHQRDRATGQLRCQLGDVVECGLIGGIQYLVGSKYCETFGLVFRKRSGWH